MVIPAGVEWVAKNVADCAVEFVPRNGADIGQECGTSTEMVSACFRHLAQITGTPPPGRLLAHAGKVTYRQNATECGRMRQKGVSVASAQCSA